jgi:sulfite dehydrogenase (cytochrome) subunit B
VPPARRLRPVAGLLGARLVSTALAWMAIDGGVQVSLLSTAAAADAPPLQTRAPAELADGAGRDVTVGRCIICHSLEYIPSNAPAMDRAGWDKTIQKMRDRFGAPITDDEARQILDYLAGNYSGKS